MSAVSFLKWSKVFGRQLLTETRGKRVYAPKTSVTDHGDPAETGSIAWCIAQINAGATAAARNGTIILPPGEFTCATKIFIEDNISLIGSGTGATLLDFNDTAGGIEVRNHQLATDGATYAVGEYVIPASEPWPRAVRFRCTTAGTIGTEADFATAALLNTDVGDTFTEGTASFEAVAGCTPHVGDFAYDMISTMTGEGIRFTRTNSFVCLPLVATGGNSTARNWAMRADSCNQWGIGKFNGLVDCNGVLLDVSDVTVKPYNFGDGYIENLDVTLTAAATCALKFQGNTSGTLGKINNVLVNRCEVIGSGQAEAADRCMVGVWFEYADRNTIKHLDVEGCNVGVMEIGGDATHPCRNNAITELHSFPSSGAQTLEYYPYARGIPFQAAAGGSYNEITIRANWLEFSKFSVLDDSFTTYLIANDVAPATRALAASGAVSAPASGIVTLTLASTLPTNDAYRGVDPRTSFPAVCINSGHPYGTRLSLGDTMDGVTQLPGKDLAFGIYQESTPDNYQFTSAIMRCIERGVLVLRTVRYVARGIKFDFFQKAPILSPELSTDNLTIERLVSGSVLTAEPSTTQAGMIVQADGSTWNPGSGAGTYVRNAADSAWVFLG